MNGLYLIVKKTIPFVSYRDAINELNRYGQ